MSIYSEMRKTLAELETIFIQYESLDPEKVVMSLKKTWGYLSKYSKNIYKDWTLNYEEILNNYDPNEHLMTYEMLRDASSTFRNLQQEISKPKYFLLKYFWILQTLLIYNKPFEESCKVCQGAVFYYYSDEREEVFKSCNTCGFTYSNTYQITFKDKIRLRPAKGREVLR